MGGGDNGGGGLDVRKVKFLKRLEEPSSTPGPINRFQLKVSGASEAVKL